jgi:UDP-N-acetylglucosamine transferase subunit ALG13
VIFVTVGTQMPFDRLVGAVDGWAAAHPARRVVAQVGPSDTRPRHIESQSFISPAECRRCVRDADLVVAHAGMGTILSALELGTPVLILPRRAALGEHRNDHQLATARRLVGTGNVSVAFDEFELVRLLDQAGQFGVAERISEYASDTLIGAVRSFIERQTQPA